MSSKKQLMFLIAEMDSFAVEGFHNQSCLYWKILNV
jgi:hypothetical protein